MKGGGLPVSDTAQEMLGTAAFARSGKAASMKVQYASTSCPSSVTSTMISHCAEGAPSAVRIVQPFALSSTMASLPMLIIGSMVKIMPGTSSMSVPRLVT